MSKEYMPFIYQGEVKLQIKIAGKFYDIETHNEGLSYLKYMFAKLLAGDKITVTAESMDLICYDSSEVIADDETSGSSFLQQPLEAEGKTYSDALGYYTEFKSFISSDNLIDIVNVDDKRVFFLYLLTGFDADTLKQYRLARINVPVSLLSKITPGTTGAVTWRMRLLNGGEVEG